MIGLVMKRVGERFALVAAAGELAIEFGILSWRVGEAEDGVAACFDAWFKERGGTGPAELVDGIAQVRRFIELHAASRFSEWKTNSEMGWDYTNGLPTRERVGYRRKLESGQTEYYIFPGVWKTEVCKGYDSRALAEELVRLKIIIPDTYGKPMSPQRPPGSEKTLRLYRLSSEILEAYAAADRDDQKVVPGESTKRKRRRGPVDC
jgi:uncharacterized protein (DUF927 family)